MKTINVRGQAVTGATFAGDFKSVKTAKEKMARMVEASGKQAGLFDNLDWLKRLFSEESPLINKDMKLSEQGKKAKAYITFHVPAVKIEFDTEKGEWLVAFTKNKKNRGLFVSSTNNDGEKIFSDNDGEDFKFSFIEWCERGKKPQAPKAPKASATTKALEKAFDKWEELEGTSDDFAELEALASRIAKAALARKAAIRAEESGKVDQSHAEQLQGITSPAEKRADTDREKWAETA